MEPSRARTTPDIARSYASPPSREVDHDLLAVVGSNE